jgi:hypothetical protein
MLRISYEPLSRCMVIQKYSIQDVYIIILYFIVFFELIYCVTGLYGVRKENVTLSQVVGFQIVVQ